MKKYLSICCLMIFLMLLINLAQWEKNGNEDMRQEQAEQQATIKRQTVYLGSDGYLDQLLSEGQTLVWGMVHLFGKWEFLWRFWVWIVLHGKYLQYDVAL